MLIDWLISLLIDLIYWLICCSSKTARVERLFQNRHNRQKWSWEGNFCTLSLGHFDRYFFKASGSCHLVKTVYFMKSACPLINLWIMLQLCLWVSFGSKVVYDVFGLFLLFHGMLLRLLLNLKVRMKDSQVLPESLVCSQISGRKKTHCRQLIEINSAHLRDHPLLQNKWGINSFFRQGYLSL